jgi:hypothetical protein
MPTEHMLETISSAYQLECDKETLKVRGGQGRDESPFVEREYLDATDYYAFMVMDYTYFLLPKYDTWVTQSQKDIGKKSLYCRKFILDIIPYLVEFLVQDGLFFIIHFPSHPLSQFLKVIIVLNSLFLTNNCFLTYCDVLSRTNF